MATQQLAKGLASLGRHGDSMLVHMSPHEVAGLNYLAKKQGTKLTINPDTGLPEAFSLGGFFKSLLPTLAGFVASGMSGGAMSPMLAGILAGSATGAVTSKDPLTGALMGGLGGYGGANLFSAANAFTPTISGATGLSPGAVGAVGTTGQMGGGNLIGSGVAGSASSNALPVGFNQAVSQAGSTMDQALLDPLVKQQISMYTPSATARQTAALGGNEAKFGSLIDNVTPAANQYAPNFEPIPGATQGFGGAPANTLSQAYKNVAANPMEFIGQNQMAVGMPIGGALLGGLEPSDIYGEPINMDKAKKKQAYDPYATLNLSGDTGLRLYAVGGTVTTGGLRDLYGTADNNTNPQLSRDGYGVGRIDNLAREQAMTQAQTLGYAEGGDVSNYGQNQAALNLDRLPSLNLGNGSSGQSEMMQKIITGFANMGESHSNPGVRKVGNLMSEGLSNPQILIDMVRDPQVLIDMVRREEKMPQGYAMGGPVSFADGGDAMKLQDEIAPIGESMGLTSLMPPATTPPASSQTMPAQKIQNAAAVLSGTASSDGSIIAQVATKLQQDPNYQPKNPIEASIVNQIKGTGPMQQGQPSPQGLGSLAPSQPMAPSYNPSQSMAPSFNPSVAMGPTYFAGINAPQGYADGGVVAGEKGMNLDELPSLNLNFVTRPSVSSSGNSSATQNILGGTVTTGGLRDSWGMGRMGSIVDMVSSRPGVAQPQPKSYALNVNSGQQEAQYAQGGYLDGAGDGMSDSIPATIEGKQPARLADGEFVIPADVVSHIGNGSSKAGSKRLYAMLDKVRHARTGNKKQGKEIKAEKYLPV